MSVFSRDLFSGEGLLAMQVLMLVVDVISLIALIVLGVFLYRAENRIERLKTQIKEITEQTARERMEAIQDVKHTADELARQTEMDAKERAALQAKLLDDALQQILQKFDIVGVIEQVKNGVEKTNAVLDKELKPRMGHDDTTRDAIDKIQSTTELLLEEKKNGNGHGKEPA